MLSGFFAAIPRESQAAGPLTKTWTTRGEFLEGNPDSNIAISGINEGDNAYATLQENGSFIDTDLKNFTPSPRTNHTSIWTGDTGNSNTANKMIIWGGSDSSYMNTGGIYNQDNDSWVATSLVNAPLSRFGHLAIWTGSKMIVWGGSVEGGVTNTGGIYDPASNLWTLTSTTNAPIARTLFSMIWTGSKIIVWGGDGGTNTGGIYDPATDTWSATSTIDAPTARYGHTAVWTGETGNPDTANRMIIWGGSNSSTKLNTGGIYNPATDTWSATSTIDAPPERASHTTVWTGETGNPDTANRMIIWGGLGSVYYKDGWYYNPASNNWSPISTINAPSSRTSPTAIWTGSKMVIWGGYTSGGGSNTGGVYDSSSDSWSATELTGAPTPRYGHTAVLTGTEMIIWGGYDSLNQIRTGTGSSYEIDTNTWSSNFTNVSPSVHALHKAVWTGETGDPNTANKMIVWGGSGTSNNAGYYSDAEGGSWVNISSTNAPTSRTYHTALWTGTDMLVWGGVISITPTNTGGKYNFASDTWSTMATLNAPSARTEHTAVWTGDTGDPDTANRMIVWGGRYGSTYYNDGAIYNPATNEWSPITSMDAPLARSMHTAIWTGDTGDPDTANRMIVWGGKSSTYYNTGAIYNSATNVWSPITVTSAPSARTGHSAIWTGSKMIVWGGNSSGLNTGGMYDPQNNTWSVTSTANAPVPRYDHTAIWTGSRMIIWGGRIGSSALYSTSYNTGGIFDPDSNIWTPTSVNNAPEKRFWHTMIWTGSQVLIWGGYNPTSNYLATGGIFELGYSTVGELGSYIYSNDSLKITWGELSWSGSTPQDSLIKYKFRTADSSDDLDGAVWSDLVMTQAYDINIESVWIEIYFYLESPSGLHAPTLNDFTINYYLLDTPANEDLLITRVDGGSLLNNQQQVLLNGMPLAWIDSNSAKLTSDGLSCSDCPTSSTNIRPEVEIKEVGVDFITNPVPGVDTLLADVGTNYVILSDLDLGRRYHIRVRAIDDEGRKSYWTNYGNNVESEFDLLYDNGIGPTFDNLPDQEVNINIADNQEINAIPYPIQVKPTDPSGIERVELYYDGNLLDTLNEADVNGVYEFSINEWPTVEGKTITAKAYDYAGLSSEISRTVKHTSVPTFENLPGQSVNINLTDNQEINAIPYPIQVKPTDPSGVEKVEFYLEDELIGQLSTEEADPVTGIYEFNLTSISNKLGGLDLRVVAYDFAGLQSELNRHILPDPSFFPYGPDINYIEGSSMDWYEPDIYGDVFAWGDTRNGWNGDIYVYDHELDIERPITLDEFGQENPAIFEDKVVWSDSRNDGGDIYTNNIYGLFEERLTTNESTQQFPDIYGSWVVFEDDRNGNLDIYAKNLATNEERQLVDNGSDQTRPSIYGDSVIWLDSRNGNQRDVYSYNFTTGITRQLITGSSKKYKPTLYENYASWGEDDPESGRQQVFLYNLDTDEKTKVTDDTDLDNNRPSISENLIAYMCGSWENVCVYNRGLANITNLTEERPYGGYLPVSEGKYAAWMDGDTGELYYAIFSFQDDDEENKDNDEEEGDDETAPDTQSPVITKIDPLTGTTGEVTTLNITATDNAEVTKLQISVDGATYTDVTGTTYALNVPLDSIADIKIKVKAFDAAGNVGESTEYIVKVTDNDAPVISEFTPPAEITTENSEVSVSATDNIAPTKATISFDNEAWTDMTGTESPFTYTIGTEGLSDASALTYNIRVYDAAGNYTTTEEGKSDYIASQDDQGEDEQEGGFIGTIKEVVKQVTKFMKDVYQKAKEAAVKIAATAAEVIKQTPPPVAHSFPYLLFIILAIFAWRLAVSAQSEAAQAAKMLEIIRLEKVIAEDKENFILLSSHYLRTPLTILKGGFDLTSATKTIQDKLSNAIAALDVEIKRILDAIEQNQYLANIRKPDLTKAKIKAYANLLIWIPIILIAGLAALANYLFINLQVIEPETINLIVQAIVFIIVAQYFYSVLRRKHTEKENLANLEKTMTYEQEMDRARNLFIEQTTASLSTKLNQVATISKSIKDKASEALTEGQHRFQAVLGNLILLKEIKSGTKVKDRSTFTAQSILASIIKAKDKDLKAKNLTIEHSGSLGTIHQNSELVSFILNTTIDNAIKFSNPDGKIGINYEGKNGMAKFTITDTGKGISKEGMMHLFKPFTRTGSALHFDYEGFGFSLFLSRIIAEHLGGDIQVQSQPGKGTTVTVRFEL